MESLLRQSYQNFEIIAIDDGSTDNSLNILETYMLSDSRIKIITQPNRGVAAARNRGIELATGDWLCFVDGDDYVHEDYLSRLLSVGVKKAADLVLCGAVYFDEESGVNLPSQAGAIKSPKFLDNTVFNMHNIKDKSILFQFQGVLWAKLFWRERFLKLRFLEGLERYSDAPYFYTSVFSAKAITYIRDCLYFYRIHKGSIQTSISEKKEYNKAIAQMREAYKFTKNQLVDFPEMSGYLDAFFNMEIRKIKSIETIHSIGNSGNGLVRKFSRMLPRKFVSAILSILFRVLNKIHAK
jgi:glycosyltransferase EpsH